MGYTLHLGDCIEVMRGMEDCSVDAICTDPPAGIAFMSAAWDRDKGGRDQWIAWLAEVMAECLRVLKPGGHAVVWSLPRTSHWTGMAIEDAGFEIRDNGAHLLHVFGTGFPKSKSLRDIGRPELGSALKPSYELWWLARKPLSEKSISANVLRWGTGALNVDAARVGMSQEDAAFIRKTARPNSSGQEHIGSVMNRPATPTVNVHPAGRWPSNLVLSHSPGCTRRGVKRVRGSNPGLKGGKQQGDGGMYGGGLHEAGRADYVDSDGREAVPDWLCHESCPVAQLDRQSGVRKSGVLDGSKHKRHTAKGWSGPFEDDEDGPAARGVFGGDTGGASRFFPTFQVDPPDVPFRYQPKAPRSERVGSSHPTQKPLKLLEWLCTLVTPPDGVILDPFMGSGTTGVAALRGGFSFVGIEQDPTYHAEATARLEAARAGQLALPLGG